MCVYVCVLVLHTQHAYCIVHGIAHIHYAICMSSLVTFIEHCMGLLNYSNVALETFNVVDN